MARSKRTTGILWGVAAVALLLLGAQLQHGDLLQDQNGDTVVRVLAFGDSLTAGLGDGIPPGENIPDGSSLQIGRGYPDRLQDYLHLPVQNAGDPGETFTTSGIFRLVPTVLSSNADVVLLFEGANDGWSSVSSVVFKRTVQKAVNVIRALGKTAVLATLPPPCCNHAPFIPYSWGYTQVIRETAAANEVALVDLAKTWATSCQSALACEFYNVPEGLHPNTLGYDAIAQTFAAELLGIDIFAPSGAADLEAALGLPAGSVVVKPEVVSQ